MFNELQQSVEENFLKLAKTGLYRVSDNSGTLKVKDCVVVHGKTLLLSEVKINSDGSLTYVDPETKSKVNVSGEKIIFTSKEVVLRFRDKIFDIYLSGFDDEKQGENCNCCKSFMKNYGDIVGIKDGKIASIFDVNAPEKYKKAIAKVVEYVNSLPISSVFLSDQQEIGVKQSQRSSKHDTVFKHFYTKIPATVYYQDCNSKISLINGSLNKLRNVCEKMDLRVMEGMLAFVHPIDPEGPCAFRGKEFDILTINGAQTSAFKALEELIIEYRASANKDNFLWLNLNNPKAALSKNTLGDLMLEISENFMDMSIHEKTGDSVSLWRKCIELFEKTNQKYTIETVTDDFWSRALNRHETRMRGYQVPIRNVQTPTKIADDKKKIEELGFAESLNRRLATPEDLLVSDVLYTNRETLVVAKGMFDSLPTRVVVPRAEGKPISMDEFITELLPIAEKVEILFNNENSNNLMTLVTGDGKSMFTYGNKFSWDYRGSVADAIKQEVIKAGGGVEGPLRFSLIWNEKFIDPRMDFDLHALLPNGYRIFFGNKGNPTTCTGMLDVDNTNPGENIAVENIVWTNLQKMAYGEYKCIMENYSSRTSEAGFRIQIAFDNKLFNFKYDKSLNGKQIVNIATVKYSKDKGFEIVPHIEFTSETQVNTIWGLETGKYYAVDTILLSPNFWEKCIGNKHFFFLVADCKTTEAVKPWHNEFLVSSLKQTSGVTMNTLANYNKISPKNDTQLSGLGFSDTVKRGIELKINNRKYLIRI